MSIRVTCSCGATAVVGDGYAGRSAKCRKCNATVIVGNVDGAAASGGEETVLADDPEGDDRLPDASLSAESGNSHIVPGNDDGSCEIRPEIEYVEPLPKEPSTWYVMTGITGKTIQEDEARALRHAGKVRVRGPLTEDQMRMYFKSEVLLPESIIRKAGEDCWRPLHSHDDNFPKSLLGRIDFKKVYKLVIRTAIEKYFFILRESPDFIDSIIKKAKVLIQKRPRQAGAVVLSICGLLFFRQIYCEYINPKYHSAPYMRNVVTFYRDDGEYNAKLGSGFFIKPGGLVVTCLHIIARAQAFIVEAGDGQRYKVEKVVYIDDENDMAVVKVSSASTPPRGLELGKSGSVKKGDHVFVFAGGKAVDEEVIGKILDIDPLTKKKLQLFKMAVTRPNWSDGGPVLDKRGQVIGVATKGPVDRAFELFPDATRDAARARGENKWRYQGSMVIPVSPLRDADSLNGSGYFTLPRDEKWKPYSKNKKGRGAEYNESVNTPSIDERSYEPDTIFDLGDGYKRLWLKWDSRLDWGRIGPDPYAQKYFLEHDDVDETSLFLTEIDCTAHQLRYNINYASNYREVTRYYNFSDDNRWVAMEPDLDKQLCPQH